MAITASGIRAKLGAMILMVEDVRDLICELKEIKEPIGRFRKSAAKKRKWDGVIEEFSRRLMEISPEFGFLDVERDSKNLWTSKEFFKKKDLFVRIYSSFISRLLDAMEKIKKMNDQKKLIEAFCDVREKCFKKYFPHYAGDLNDRRYKRIGKVEKGLINLLELRESGKINPDVANYLMEWMRMMLDPNIKKFGFTSRYMALNAKLRSLDIPLEILD